MGGNHRAGATEPLLGLGSRQRVLFLRPLSYLQVREPSQAYNYDLHYLGEFYKAIDTYLSRKR